MCVLVCPDMLHVCIQGTEQPEIARRQQQQPHNSFDNTVTPATVQGLDLFR